MQTREDEEDKGRKNADKGIGRRQTKGGGKKT
jgi:hypothetical protein